MSQQDAFERVVASLHEATLDDSLWDRTSGLIGDACRSMGNQMVFCDDSAGRPGVLFARFCLGGQRHKEAEIEYYNRFFATDEHVPRLWQLPDSRIVPVTDLFSEEELKTSPTYNEGMARSHAQNSLRVRRTRRAQRQACLNSQIRVSPLATPRRAARRAPHTLSLITDPNRQITPLAQALVIFCPVDHPVLRLIKLVPSRCVELMCHLNYPRC